MVAAAAAAEAAVVVVCSGGRDGLKNDTRCSTDRNSLHIPGDGIRDETGILRYQNNGQNYQP